MMVYNRIQNAAFRYHREITGFYAIFYFVGVIGLLIPETRQFFIRLVPFALILGFMGVLFFHEDLWNKKTVAVFFAIFAAGFLIESIGVNTGVVFGKYQYGNTLGVQIFKTPLIIGMNWIFLVYVTSSMVDKISSLKLIKLIFPPVLMVIYDLIMEQVAPTLDMWRWENNIIPLQNYFAWFVIGFVFNLVFKIFDINTTNRIALLLYIVQLLFFLLLFLKISLF